mgnify:CR=1 FL=1
MSNRAEGRHIGAKGNGPNGISSHCASREGHAERAGQRLEILHAAPEGNNRDCREACGRRAGAHASSGKERRGRGENVRKIGCKRCRMTSECILEGAQACAPLRLLKKQRANVRDAMKGGKPFIFICIARLCWTGGGDFAKRQRSKIISAALSCRMKPFILQEACQKRSF